MRLAVVSRLITSRPDTSLFCLGWLLCKYDVDVRGCSCTNRCMPDNLLCDVKGRRPARAENLRRRGATIQPITTKRPYSHFNSKTYIVRAQQNKKTKRGVSRTIFSATIDTIPLRLQGGYFIEVNDLEWPTQPIPAAAHRADSHVLQ